MKRLYPGLTALSIALFFTPPVFATSIATATLTDLTVTLTSTDGGTGGTPSIFFGAPDNYSYLSGFVTEPTNTSYSYYVNPTGANSVSTPLGSATSSITGNGTFAALTSTNFVASASANGSGSVSTTSVGEAGTYTPFTLGPDSTAMFSSTGSVSANTTEPSDNAQAYAYLQVAGSSSGPTFIVSSSQSVYYFASGQNGTDQAQSGAMNVDISNPTGADLTGYLYAYTNTEAVSTVAAPEIDTASAASGFTLLLGGLAVLRGRKQQAA